MKKLHLFKTVLLLCALIVGSMNGWATDDPEVTLDFTSQSYWNIPTSGTNKSLESYTDGTYTIKLSATTNYKLNNGYLILGKKDSYLELPAFSFDVEKIEVVGASGASESVKQNIYVGETAVSTETTGAKNVTNSYTIASGYETAGKVYQLVVTSAHNTQISKIHIYKKASSKTATTTTITETGITNTYINQGNDAGSLSAAVTETESGDAVGGATVTWTSSDESVATIASNGAVTLVGVGSTNLKATYAGDETYAGSNDTYKLTVTDSRADAGLSFGEASYTCDKFIAFVAPTLNTADGFDGTPVYESSDESVATVDSGTGVVTIKAVGTTTISVHSDATTNFQAGDAEYELTVTIHEGLDPINPAGVGRYVKVTNTEDITDGNYLIVYEGDSKHDAVAFKGSLGTFDIAENGIAVTITDNAIAATDAVNAEAFTIDTTTGFIQGTSGKYIGATSYTNSLVTSNDGIENSFAIENESATIGVTIGEQTVTMRYNYASDQLRFRYYKSGQQPIQLYKYEAGSAAKVTLSADGYKTMVGTQPFSASGANIYIVTATDTEKATMTKITKAPANTPVILKGESNAEVSLSVEDAGDNASANLLQISTESTGNGVYVLAKKDDVVAFYEWDGGSLGTGRVYLPKPASGDAREMISFYFEDEETTGINTTLTTNERMNNEVYNLNGQRVAQPTKGLYIVNGKKYIVK